MAWRQSALALLRFFEHITNPADISINEASVASRHHTRTVTVCMPYQEDLLDCVKVDFRFLSFHKIYH